MAIIVSYSSGHNNVSSFNGFNSNSNNNRWRRGQPAVAADAKIYALNGPSFRQHLSTIKS